MNIQEGFIQQSFIKLVFLATIALLQGCGISSDNQPSVIKSEILILTYNNPTYSNFKWLDNQHIIAVNYSFNESNPTLESKPLKKLVIWNIGNKELKTLPYTNVGSLCVNDGLISFYTKEKVYTNSKVNLKSESRKNDVESYSGTLNNLQRHKYGPVDFMSCKRLEDISLPEWAQSIDPLNIIRLKPQHGFLWIDRYVNKIDVRKPKGIWLYPPNTNKSQGINISKFLKEDYVNQGANREIKYFHFQKAYWYSSLNKDWWIYPNGKIEAIQPISKTNFKWESYRKYLSEPVITKVGMVFGTRDYKNLFIDENDGLFKRDEKLDIHRLVKGRIDSQLELSPDGCKVAFSVDRRETLNTPSGSLIGKLEVIDLCKEK